jgi:hypothetical protein
VKTGRKAWTVGPIITAYSTVPRPTTPPISQPTASTATSIEVRTRRMLRPERRTSPVINPSRGPGPNWLPM